MSETQSQSLPLDPSLLYTDEETARFLRSTPGTLAVWRSTKRYSLRYRKIGGKVLYMGRDILNFIDAPHQRARPYTPKNPRPKVAKPTRRRRVRP